MGIMSSVASLPAGKQFGVGVSSQGLSYLVLRNRNNAIIAQATIPSSSPTSSFPLGYTATRAKYMPIKDGGMACRQMTGSASLTAAVEGIGNLQAALTGTSSITPNMNKGVQLVAALTGTSNISAGIDGVGNLECNIQIGARPSAGDIADLVLQEEVETGFSLKKAMRLILSAVAGKLSGAETTSVVIRDVNDSKDRISATVDSNGNRTAVTYDTED